MQLPAVGFRQGRRAFPFHNHLGNDKMFVFLKGTGTYRYGEAEHSVKAGAVCAAPRGGPDTPHQLINTGNEELKASPQCAVRRWLSARTAGSLLPSRSSRVLISCGRIFAASGERNTVWDIATERILDLVEFLVPIHAAARLLGNSILCSQCGQSCMMHRLA